MKRVYYSVSGWELAGWPITSRDFTRLTEARAYLRIRGADMAVSVIERVTVEDVPVAKRKKAVRR
jgi:hypothetical protein